MATKRAGLPQGLGEGRDGRDLENGRDLEVQPLVQHFAYDPNSRWHRFKQAMMEPPKSTVSIYADIPFNHAEWKRHRNAAWRHRPQPVLFMRVAGGFWWQLTYSFVVSLLVGIYHHHQGTITSAASKLAVPFNLTTFALSLLLVFRTNSSYSRWWEARQIWGAVVNLSRNFSRQSMLWLPPRQARVAVRWMMAAPYLLKCHLRFNASVRENVSHVLLPQELDWVLGWTHRPNGAAHVLATAVVEGGIDTNREQILMELINTFIDCVGKCERIFKTPIPAAYTRHTSRYLMIYLTACPLVLWPSLGWWTLITAVLITFLLLGTENIGVQIEEPFRVLPLDDMCRGIEATLREMERQHNRLGQEFGSWTSDPAGLPRSSSESSLDSFQDGPADGPSEPAALQRFHNIPPPAPLAAAAHALRVSLARPGGAAPSPAAAGGGSSAARDSLGRATSGSGELPHHIGTMGRLGSGRLLSGVLTGLHGGASSGGSPSTGGGVVDAGAADASSSDHEKARGCGVGEGSVGGGSAAAHWPHHVHHGHRHLPQHPADVPSSTASVTGRSRLSHDPVERAGTSDRSATQGRHIDMEAPALDSASPFARPSLQAGNTHPVFRPSGGGAGAELAKDGETVVAAAAP